MALLAMTLEQANRDMALECRQRHYPKKLHMKSFTHKAKKYWVSAKWCECLAQKYSPRTVCKHRKKYHRQADSYDMETYDMMADHRDAAYRKFLEKCPAEKDSDRE